MTNWREEYLDNLRSQERESVVDLELIQAYSQLQDRIATLESEKALLQLSRPPSTDPPAKSAGKKEPATGTNAASDPASDAKLQVDLAEALRSKTQFENRLRTAEEELQKLRTKTASDAKTIKQITAERTHLLTKLKDRDHEIREKLKLVQSVQDEMIMLSLQLNLAEQERDKVKKDNKDLVDRWMQRMAQEADAMNLANEPIFEKSR